MRDIAIVAATQRPLTRSTTLTSVELIAPVITQVLEAAGIDRHEVGFWCHGSCDYMSGQPFSFVSAVDAIGAWPPIVESHVEGDGALALYEAWMRIEPCVLRDGQAERWDVVGPVCESGDWLGRDRMLAVVPGDLLAVLSAGAYGMAMASNYNTRARAAELMLDGTKVHLIREREALRDLYAHERLIDG